VRRLRETLLLAGEPPLAQALVEFAFVLPIMLVLTLGLIDLGRAFVFGVSVQEGARQATRIAATAGADTTLTDAAVLGRLISASSPALTGCAAVTAVQTCNGGSWTLRLTVQSSGSTYSSLAAARAADALPGSRVTVTAAGAVGLLAGVQTGLFGLRLPEIGVQGQAAMVVL